jgi:diacylglycerol kinase family enzyme
LTSTWLAIVNPRAGFPRPLHWQKAIEKRLRQELGAEVVFTERPGHAAELAAASHSEALAVFGGDGTIAEAVNGMDLDRQRLLLLAGGTGNGLARDLGLTSLRGSLSAAQAGRLRALDLIRISFDSRGQSFSRLAISTASIGYAAEVVALANRYFKPLGTWCYPLASTLQAARQAVFPVIVSVGNADPAELKLSNLMVNNTRHAGNFRAFRRADAGDGRMEVLLAAAGCGSQLLHNLAVLTRTYFYASAAEVSAQTLIASLPEPRRLMIDGELWEAVSQARFEVLAGRLRCVA